MASDVRREANKDRLNIREDKSAIEIRAAKRECEGPMQGKVYVVTPLIEYLTVLL